MEVSVIAVAVRLLVRYTEGCERLVVRGEKRKERARGMWMGQYVQVCSEVLGGRHRDVD